MDIHMMLNVLRSIIVSWHGVYISTSHYYCLCFENLLGLPLHSSMDILQQWKYAYWFPIKAAMILVDPVRKRIWMSYKIPPAAMSIIRFGGSILLLNAKQNQKNVYMKSKKSKGKQNRRKGGKMVDWM